MHITSIKAYGCAQDKLCRLGLFGAFLDLQETILNNPASTVLARTQIAPSSVAISPNLPVSLSTIREVRNNGVFASRLGVKSLISTSCKELILPRIFRMRNMLQKGVIDVGAIIVPSERFASLLSARTPSLVDAIRVIEHEIPEASREADNCYGGGGSWRDNETLKPEW